MNDKLSIMDPLVNKTQKHQETVNQIQTRFSVLRRSDVPLYRWLPFPSMYFTTGVVLDDFFQPCKTPLSNFRMMGVLPTPQCRLGVSAWKWPIHHFTMLTLANFYSRETMCIVPGSDKSQPPKNHRKLQELYI